MNREQNTVSIFGWIRRAARYDVLFLCSATVDEVWIRSTAQAVRRLGLSAYLAVCDDGGEHRKKLVAFYSRLGIPAEFGLSFAEAARIRCRIAVTASSGLDRVIFPTRAPLFVHMPHSLASLHMVYPAGAFDGYDILFAAGPHHTREFEALVQARGLEGRSLFPVGYGKLDVMSRPDQVARQDGRHVLIAPSWGPDNLLERCGLQVARAIAERGFTVTVRPHPLFVLENAPIVSELKALSEREPRIRYESPLDGDHAIFEADVMIGDYSGTSFEFAALRRRPVVSVNVGYKVANPDWESLGLTPMEIGGRRLIGPVVDPDVEAIAAAACDPAIQGIDEEGVSNFLYGSPGDCGPRAAAILMDLLTSGRA